MKIFLQIVVILSFSCSVFGQLQMSIKKMDNTIVNILLDDITDVTFDSSIPMVKVTGGTFLMGAPTQTNQHSVTLSTFYIGQTEITQGQWQAVMGSNPSGFPAVGSTAPVEKVTWFDCLSFCNKLSILEGIAPCYTVNGSTDPATWPTNNTAWGTAIISCDMTKNGYRLPTEAEWEFAAKGGNLMQSTPYTYSGSNTVDDVAWNSGISGSTTHTVAGKQGNELGIYDMSGNVFEWCWDWYGNYTSNTQTDPTGPGTGTARVLRGGAWFRASSYCAVVTRNNPSNPSNNYNFCGLRIVKR